MIRRVGLGQRIVLVIALAFVLALVGAYVSSLGNPANFGWFGYAPAPGIQIISGPDLTPWEQLLVWIGLIAAWAAGSVVLLRPSRERRDLPLTRAGRPETGPSSLSPSDAGTVL